MPCIDLFRSCLFRSVCYGYIHRDDDEDDGGDDEDDGDDGDDIAHL